MPNETPSQLLDLAYKAVNPHRGPGAQANDLVITGGKLRMIPQGANPCGVIVIMQYTKKMMEKGLTSYQWDTLLKRLIKHRKEINE